MGISGIVWIYLVVINLFALALYGADKRKAKKHAWRISEKALFLVAVAGGSLGALFGMLLFHHKTKHWYFVIGIPLILAVQIFLLWKFGILPAVIS